MILFPLFACIALMLDAGHSSYFAPCAHHRKEIHVFLVVLFEIFFIWSLFSLGGQGFGPIFVSIFLIPIFGAISIKLSAHFNKVVHAFSNLHEDFIMCWVKTKFIKNSNNHFSIKFKPLVSGAELLQEQQKFFAGHNLPYIIQLWLQLTFLNQTTSWPINSKIQSNAFYLV